MLQNWRTANKRGCNINIEKNTNNINSSSTSGNNNIDVSKYYRPRDRKYKEMTNRYSTYKVSTATEKYKDVTEDIKREIGELFKNLSEDLERELYAIHQMCLWIIILQVGLYIYII